MMELYSKDANIGPQGWKKGVKLAAHNHKPFNSKVLGDLLHLQQVQTQPATFQPLLKVKTILVRPLIGPASDPPLIGGAQNDDFRPLTYTLGGRGMGCRNKYVTSWDPS
jgi:hypothetical protein